MLTEFVLEARADFDMVLIDTPGVVEGEDAILVGRAARSALVLARPRVTRTAILSHLVSSLRQVEVNVAGTVLNEVPRRGVAR